MKFIIPSPVLEQLRVRRASREDRWENPIGLSIKTTSKGLIDRLKYLLGSTTPLAVCGARVGRSGFNLGGTIVKHQVVSDEVDGRRTPQIIAEAITASPQAPPKRSPHRTLHPHAGG